jgi:hypothetical protein
MNERIKQLAEQAEDDVVADHRGDEFHKAYTQRFAELIVKETMQVVANQLPSNQYLDVADAVIEHYKD